MSYVLASPTGLMVGFWFFLVLSVAIAVMIYVLLTRPSVRRREIGLGAVRTSIASPLAFVIWLAIFSMIYLSSLAGFHTVTVSDVDLRLEYALPPVTASVRHAEIGDVIRRPAYKSQWRLEIYTQTGSRFESAPGSYREIKAAAEDIERRRQKSPVRASPGN